MKLFNSKGRIRRTEYALYTITSTIIFLSCINGAACASFYFPQIPKVILAITMLIALIAYGFISIAMITKRFNDLDKTTSLITLLIPGYNLYTAFELMFKRGTNGVNSYGDDPKLQSKYDFLSLIRNYVVIIGLGVILVSVFIGLINKSKESSDSESIETTMINKAIYNQKFIRC